MFSTVCKILCICLSDQPGSARICDKRGIASACSDHSQHTLFFPLHTLLPSSVPPLLRLTSQSKPRTPPHSLSLLSSLESQNDTSLSLISSKVTSLKQLTQAIGAEIRDSTKLADEMNEGFDSTRSRLKGTMGRMLRMAERTGVGWKAWVGFFTLVWVVFVYVWLF